MRLPPTARNLALAYGFSLVASTLGCMGTEVPPPVTGGGGSAASGTTGAAAGTTGAGAAGTTGAGTAGTTGVGTAGTIGAGTAGTTGAGTAGTTGAGTAGTTARGGTTGAGTAGTTGAGTAGTTARGGTTGTAGSSAAAGRGGTTGGAGRGGTTGTAGTTGGGGTSIIPTTPLDCGTMGTALENHGPPANRLNYVIVADGYSQAELAAGGTLDKHLMNTMAKRFSDPIGQPYLRYRNFVNICVLRIPSTPICGSSTFGCCGNDSSRLANCNTTTVNNAIRDNLPASFEVDWRSVVLNGSSWWNSGGTVMMWSGGNADGPGAALHEGGHGHNQLADEYDACEQSRVSREAAYGVNVSLMNGSTGGKWDGWLNYNQTPGTGMQGFFACTGGATWRPSSNSMMNSLFGNNPNTSFNAVSREKIVMDIWRAVQQPYDSVEPAAGAVTNPSMLKLNVIDPAVISVDWTVDGGTAMKNAGPTFMVTGLASGQHTITARAYDNATMDLVRQVPGTTFYRQFWGSGAMGHSDKTVTWTVTIP